MTPQGFDYLRKLLRERSGLVLAAEKQYLAESRLLPVARRNGMTTIDELIDCMKSKASVSLATQVVEAMTTNETFFFRDKLPFDHFRDTIMPALIAARSREKRIRIWCTAASTGQEPYSLAMLFKGMGAAISGYRIDILATDLSSDILEKAKQAEEAFHSSSITPASGATIRKLAELSPKTLAIMHGSSFNGDSVRALRDLADLYDRWFRHASLALAATA